METKHTPGPWAVGRRGGCVVSAAPIPGMREGTGHDDVEHYGGYLIGESIWRKEDAQLIAAAPELLEALQAIVDLPAHPMRKKGVEIARAAIAKATGQS